MNAETRKRLELQEHMLRDASLDKDANELTRRVYAARADDLRSAIDEIDRLKTELDRACGFIGQLRPEDSRAVKLRLGVSFKDAEVIAGRQILGLEG